MAANTVALDTNVLIYLHDNSSPSKRDIAKILLAGNPNIASQVISEYLNTTRRLLDLSKEELLIQAAGLFSDCTIVPVSINTILSASTLIKKYKFQLFDAMLHLQLTGIVKYFILRICSTGWL
jgi:predicted nucleic acid-binding protein